MVVLLLVALLLVRVRQSSRAMGTRYHLPSILYAVRVFGFGLLCDDEPSNAGTVVLIGWDTRSYELLRSSFCAPFARYCLFYRHYPVLPPLISCFPPIVGGYSVDMCASPSSWRSNDATLLKRKLGAFTRPKPGAAAAHGQKCSRRRGMYAVLKLLFFICCFI